MEVNADKLLGFCEAMLSRANKSADEAKNDVSVNMNVGAILAYSTVIEFLKKEMRDGRGTEGACGGVCSGCEGVGEEVAED